MVNTVLIVQFSTSCDLICYLLYSMDALFLIFIHRSIDFHVLIFFPFLFL